jgi:leader peptidase (prepilin peptidase)/N-methyltransferase
MHAMSTSYGAVLSLVFGGVIGSFLNVVAHRLPRGESLVRPRSRCPSCGTAIRPYDNVPVLSWLLLRGRCRDCGEPISVRYPIVEAVTALLCAAVVVAEGPHAVALLGIALVLVLVPITLIDLEVRLIPNVLTIAGSLVALAILGATDPGKIPGHLIAAAAAGGLLFAIVFVYPRGMGMGDAKLVGMLGLFLGRSVGVALFAGFLLGSVVGVAIMARVGVASGRKKAIPFGPYLALGGLFAYFAGDAIVDWYLGTFN